MRIRENLYSTRISRSNSQVNAVLVYGLSSDSLLIVFEFDLIYKILCNWELLKTKIIYGSIYFGKQDDSTSELASPFKCR